METQEYYEKGRYRKDIGEWQRKHLRLLLNILKEDLHKLNPQKILDVGSGNGVFTKMIKDETGACVYGVDISETALKLTKQKGIEVKKCDLNKKIPFKNGVFDLVVGKQVIEHVYSPDHFLSECNRVLKVGGHVVLTTPNLVAWYNRILFFLGVYPIFLEVSMRDKLAGTKFMRRFAETKQGVGHIRLLTVDALKDLLELNNFVMKKNIGLERDFGGDVPALVKRLYGFLDWVFSKVPSLSSDILVIGKKRLRKK